MVIDNFSFVFVGTGEAGKTTFIKQMRIIHGSGFEENDRLEYKKIVFQNIYDGISKLGEAMDTLSIQYKIQLPEVNSIFIVLKIFIVPFCIFIRIRFIYRKAYI